MGHHSDAPPGEGLRVQIISLTEPFSMLPSLGRSSISGTYDRDYDPKASEAIATNKSTQSRCYQ